MSASLAEGGLEGPLSPEEWGAAVRRRVEAGGRLAGLYGTDEEDEEEGCRMTALVAGGGEVVVLTTVVEPDRDGIRRYRSLTPGVPAAFWYERALHDLSGVVPVGHPRLDPLLLARDGGSPAPRPGAAPESAVPRPEESHGPVDLAGQGMFSLPLGPVRSGVVESIELLIETPGEDIPHLNVRPHYKHRGIAKQFEGRSPADGVLVAERVEGISSVAHALAFCQAVEAIAGITPSSEAALVRVLLAELERMANHLDVTMKLADAAGLAVAFSRFGWHKEKVLRLISGLCESRFARGVIGVGGLARPVRVDAPTVRARVASIADAVRADLAALETSASFLDRLRGTGPLSAARAAEHGALGPIGRASGADNDVRRERPYAAYAALSPLDPPPYVAGDALARARVRWHELDASAALIGEVLEMMGSATVVPVRLTRPVPDGFGLGWTESAQGEVVHAVELRDGVLRRCFARSASFHNLVLLHDVFAGDIFTDLPFIEASFGLGYAGVAM